jgi:hypothetical protein
MLRETKLILGFVANACILGACIQLNRMDILLRIAKWDIDIQRGILDIETHKTMLIN